MKFFFRIMLFVLVAGLLFAPAIVGCDDSNENDPMLLGLALLNSVAPKQIYIYDGGLHNGNLSGSTGANDLCVDAAYGYTLLDNASVKKAFLSFPGVRNGDIKDLVPARYAELPVFGFDAATRQAQLLKDHWSDLWDSSGIMLTLQAAIGIDANWWLGSQHDGSSYSSTFTCNSWTSESNLSSGILGSYDNGNSYY